MVLSSSLAGTFCYFLGLHKAPKNKIFTDIKKDYEETIEGLRKEKKRWQSTANFYKQGAVNMSTIDRSDSGDVIEGVINALPPNFRSFIEPFKGQAKEWAKNNPEAVEEIKNKLMSKLSKASGEATGENGNSAQVGEML